MPKMPPSFLRTPTRSAHPLDLGQDQGTVGGGRAVLQLEGIAKAFAGTLALSGVDLTLRAGCVHALVGENGAGKSTLIKILTGAYRRDRGTIRLLGRPVEFRSPKEAQAHGVVAVYQELNLLLSLSVAENIYLGREPRRWRFLDWRRMNDEAEQLLRTLGVELDPRAALGSLTVALRQMVAIARAISLGAKVVVLDEPTSSLPQREVALLYQVLARLRAADVAVLYISHRLDELYEVCDWVTILRDGQLVRTCPLAELSRLDLVSLMLGIERDELRQGKTGFEPRARVQVAASAVPLLRAEQLASPGRLGQVAVAVECGEIVGVAGLLGSGRSALLRVLFGLDRLTSGTVWLLGRVLPLRSPGDAIAAGLAFLPEDRQREGIVPELSVRDNLTLAALPGLTRLGIVSRARQDALVTRFMERLHIKASSAEQKIAELSGGNQQKVLLARWLCRQPRLLLLDEPTRGIDIGAKAEIQELISELAASGLGVLMVSSELAELIEGSARVVVLRDGVSVAELRGSGITQSAILRAMANGHTLPPAGGSA